MTPVRKTVVRSEQTRRKAEALLAWSGAERGDHDVNDNGLYSLRYSNHSAVVELKPLFRIPDADPGGQLTIEKAFRTTVIATARQILPLLSDSKVPPL